MGAVAQLVTRLREMGATVHEWPGWQGRGNSGVSEIDPRGAVIHHTGSGYGSAYQALVTGIPSLQGMLCNFAGNADGSLTVIGSGLAWHAGPGAGPSLGPLYPYRSNMNYYTVGLEIVYPGVTPMTDAQYSTAVLFGRAVADLFAGGDPQAIRAHAETNGNAPGGDGKWDPGYASGQVIDMPLFRGLVQEWNGEDMTPEEHNLLVEVRNLAKEIRSRAASVQTKGFAEVGLDEPRSMAGNLDWFNLPKDQILSGLKDLTTKVNALAADVAVLKASGIPATVDYDRVADAVADEQDKRGRDGDPDTGPVS